MLRQSGDVADGDITEDEVKDTAGMDQYEETASGTPPQRKVPSFDSGYGGSLQQRARVGCADLEG